MYVYLNYYLFLLNFNYSITDATGRDQDSGASTVITGQIIMGKMYNYNKLIPSGPTPFFFDQKQLIQRPKRKRKQPQELPRSLAASPTSTPVWRPFSAARRGRRRSRRRNWLRKAYRTNNPTSSGTSQTRPAPASLRFQTQNSTARSLGAALTI